MSNIHERRTRFAIRCKRVLGEWVPQSGPIEDADKILTRMHNQLINSRAGIKPLRDPFHSQLKTRRVLEIYARSDNRRRMMTARRIMHRLGLIEDRADAVEKRNWSRARFESHYWLTTLDLTLDDGLRLMAGTQVFYGGGGEFSNDSVDLTAEQARLAGVKQLRKSQVPIQKKDNLRD